MTNERKRMRNPERPGDAGSASPVPYLPTIGRLVLNDEAFAPALAHLKEHTRTFFEEVHFVQFVTRGHYWRLGRTDAQHILDTLSEHPAYRPDDFNSPLDCRVVRPRDTIKNHNCRQLLLQITAIGDQNRLRDQRATLLNHMSEDPVPPKDLTTGFRVPLASITGYEGTIVTLQDGLMPLLPEVVTLGPIQLEPMPPPTESSP